VITVCGVSEVITGKATAPTDAVGDGAGAVAVGCSTSGDVA